MSEYAKQSEPPGKDGDDLITGLEELGHALDSVEYPGKAWSHPPKLMRKWIIRMMTASAAAAAIILIVFTMRGTFDAPKFKAPPERRIVAAPQTQITAPLVAVAEPLFSIDIPTSIDLPLVNQIDLPFPTISFPPITNISPTVTVDLQLPTLSALWIEPTRWERERPTRWERLARPER